MSRRTLGSRFPAFASLHILASAAGGIAGVLALRLIAHQFGLSSNDPWTFVGMGVVLLVAVMTDLRLIRIRVPTTGAQVPGGWRHRLTPSIWVTGYGLLLGFTLLTRISSGVVLAALLTVAVLPSEIVVPLTFGAVYGAARGSVVLRDRIATDPTWYATDNRLLGVAVALPLVVLWVV